ncbi:MAG: small multi-drug export protein [Candidatus Aenigmarchaeota archaeon]|nr:small multi-drug export protein [Candidatus Aenigmarchaeota archaeon]
MAKKNKAIMLRNSSKSRIGKYHNKHTFLNNNKLIYAAKFITPIAILLLFIGAVYLVLDQSTFTSVFYLISVELVAPFSFEVSAPIAVGLGLSLPVIIIVLVVVDVLITLFVVWNYGLLERAPGIGKYFIKFDNKMRTFVKEHKLEKISMIGLFLYYLSPLSLSGAFSIGIVGKLLQMDNWKIIAITIAGTIAGTIIFSTTMIGLLALLGF